MLPNVPKGKVFSLGLYRQRQALQVIRKKFHGRISPQDYLRRRMNQSLDLQALPSHFFMQNIFFNQLKISAVTDLVENFKSEKTYCKTSVSKNLGRGALSSETGMSQTHEMKTISAKIKWNGVNFGVVSKLKFRYLVAKFLLV